MRRRRIRLALLLLAVGPVVAADENADPGTPFTFRFAGLDPQGRVAFACDRRCAWVRGSVSSPGLVTHRGFVGFGPFESRMEPERGVRFALEGRTLSVRCNALACSVTTAEGESRELDRGQEHTVPAAPGVRITVH